MSDGHPVRATVRYRLDPPPGPGLPPLTDAVGTVLVNSAQEIVLQTRRGVVRIPRDLVVATRIVPPAAPRRGVLAGEVPPLTLHRTVTGCWPPEETGHLGDWLLRASGGFTARANSVVPEGSPGLALPEAIERVEHWYAARSLPPNVTVAGPVGFDPAQDGLGGVLTARGYVVSAPTLFLTAPLHVVRDRPGPSPASPGLEPGVQIDVDPELHEDWLDAYEGYRAGGRASARTILTGSPYQRFATARVGSSVVGVARVGVSGGWAGIAAMWVDPAHRRRGVARALEQVLARAAGGLGADRMHLQVWAANAPALALYRGAGFRVHHAYVNVSAPLP